MNPAGAYFEVSSTLFDHFVETMDGITSIAADATRLQLAAAAAFERGDAKAFRHFFDQCAVRIVALGSLAQQASAKCKASAG